MGAQERVTVRPLPLRGVVVLSRRERLMFLCLRESPAAPTPTTRTGIPQQPLWKLVLAVNREREERKPGTPVTESGKWGASAGFASL